MKFLSNVIILTVALMAFMSCSAPVLPTPHMGTVDIETEGSQEVYIDGLYIGETPLTATIIENYPNYLQVGSWKFVLVPPCTYDLIRLSADPDPTQYSDDEMVLDLNFQ